MTTYRDRDGAELLITACDDGDINPGCIHIDTPGNPVCVGPQKDLPRIIADLYETAGKPAPIILERPDPARSYTWMIPGISFAIRSSGVEIVSTGSAADSGCLHEPARIRELAARIAEMAEQAERAAEPDPAEVEELTAVLRGVVPGMAVPGGDYRTGVARNFAEAALRWMREREAAS